MVYFWYTLRIIGDNSERGRSAIQLHFIEPGTDFEVEILAGGESLKNMMNAKLHEIHDDYYLVLDGDALYERCSDMPRSQKLRVTFVRGMYKYVFDALFTRTIAKSNGKSTEIVAVSDIKETNRRSYQRFSVHVDVNLHSRDENGDEKPIGLGKTEDICVDALSLLYDEDLVVDENSVLTVDFTLFGTKRFKLPVRVLNKKTAPRGAHYRYIYVLLFDFTDHQKEKVSIGSVILENYLK